MSAGSAGLVLVLSSGANAPRSIELPPATTSVLGSSPERANVVIEGLADAHCAIGRLARGGWALRDLGSLYGTRVNGKRVDSTRLAHGDLLELGEVELRVLDPSLEHLPNSGERPGPPEELVLPEAPPPPGARMAAVRPPERIGGFRILRTLGKGSTGDVVLAVQESLERRVALKLLAPRLATDAAFVRRFQTEARAAASLSHPNVVVVYDVGEADGWHFIAMEHMERGSLEARVTREGPLPWRVAVLVLAEACAGLVYAEQRGIVHRDIKPANLMQNAAGTTKIADLGLAQPVLGEGGGAAVGTPHFVSPEQARGLPADKRSDLYSLGATAYRLLTGRTPFDGATTREILRAVFAESPAPVSRHAPDVPMELDRLVARLLQKDPAERPGSAREVVLDLERLRLGIAARPADPAPIEARGGRGRIARALAAAAFLAVLGVAAWLVAESLGLREATAPAERRALGAALPEFADEEDRSAPAPPVAADDAALEALEARAQDAYSNLSAGSDPAARRAALEGVVSDFGGTTAAARAAGELARLAEAERADSTSAARLAGERAAVLDDLRARTRNATAAEALRRIRAFVPPGALIADAELAAELGSMAQTLVTDARADLERATARADAAARRGDFAAVAAELEEALGQLDAPGLVTLAEGGAAPTFDGRDLEPLLSAAERLLRRLDSLDDEERARRAERDARDADLRARGLARGEGLEAELRRGDLDAAATRLEELAVTLETPGERERLAALALDARAGAAVLSMLARELALGGWRRRTVLDPRSGRATAREIVAWDARGLLYDEGNGVAELPLGALATRPEALDGLFSSRLSRDYTPAEVAGIAALVRFASVLASIESLAGAFAFEIPSVAGIDPGGIADAFVPAHEWSRRAGETKRLAAEQRAAEGLYRAFAAADGQSLTEASELLHEVLASDTLLVLLLSDGSSIPGAGDDP